MTRTITRMFDSRAEAEAAVRDLETLGVSHQDLSIIAHGQEAAGERRSFLDSDPDGNGKDDVAGGAGTGAAVGGALGAGAGLLAGLGMLVIPGVGPVLAAGWLGATLIGGVAGAATGAAAGSLLGALKEAGVDDDHAHVYAEGVRRGGAIVSARVSDDMAPAVEEVLDRRSSFDVATRAQAYRQEGWTRFDPDRPM